MTALSIDGLKIDVEAQKPIYLQIAEQLRNRILSGAIRTGDALPPERELSEKLGVSRVTIRKAIELLMREGHLSRRQGSGTYIAPRIEQAGGLLAGFSADMNTRGLDASSIWLERITSFPAPEEAMALGISLDQTVQKMTRVRLANDEPLAIENAVVPTVFLPSLEIVDSSLYQALERLGHLPQRGLQRLQASLATPEEAHRLCVPPGSAILRIERRSLLASGQVVEFTRSAYRGDRYDFVTELREPLLASNVSEEPKR